MDKVTQQINEFFTEQGFEKVDMGGEFLAKRGQVYTLGGSYGLLSRQNNTYFLECIDGEKDARLGLFEDIGVYHLEEREEKIITQIKSDIIKYIVEDLPETSTSLPVKIASIEQIRPDELFVECVFDTVTAYYLPDLHTLQVEQNHKFPIVWKTTPRPQGQVFFGVKGQKSELPADKSLSGILY